MADETTLNQDMKVYNQLAQTAYLERTQDVIEIFNGNSQGAIQLINEAVVGDFSQSAIYKLSGSIEHRDVNAETLVELKKIASDEIIDVKVPWKYGPYSSTEEAFKRRARNPAEFAQVVGQDMADAVLEGQIANGIAALFGGIGGNASMIVSASLATDGKKVLTKGMRTLGDRFGRLAVWVMDSEMYFDIVDQAIDNKVYEEAGVVIYGGSPGTLGKPVLVTDKMTSGYIAGLQAGAVTLKESQAPGMRVYDIDNQENLAIGIRAEGAFNVGVLGYSWKTTAGSNPNAAALAATENWSKYAVSDKATAGFLINLNGAASGSGV